MNINHITTAIIEDIAGQLQSGIEVVVNSSDLGILARLVVQLNEKLQTTISKERLADGWHLSI